MPFPSPGDIADPGIEPTSPALAGGFLTTETPGKPLPCSSSSILAQKANVQEKSIFSIKPDTAEEKISELDRQIKVHKEEGLEIIEKRVRELRGTMKRWCVNITGVPGGTDTPWAEGEEARFEETLSNNCSKVSKNFKPQSQ